MLDKLMQLYIYLFLYFAKLLVKTVKNVYQKTFDNLCSMNIGLLRGLIVQWLGQKIEHIHYVSRSMNPAAHHKTFRGYI